MRDDSGAEARHAAPTGVPPTEVPEAEEYSGDDPVRLRAQVERTRERLGDTVEELAARADVKARAREKASEARERASHAGGAARRRLARAGPVPLIAVGAAVTIGAVGAAVQRHRHCGGR